MKEGKVFYAGRNDTARDRIEKKVRRKQYVFG